MKIALITDQHFGVRGDNLQFHEYYRKFYNECFFPELEKRNIKTVVELGDIFDRRKYINFDSLSRCRSYFFDPLKEKNINLHCIVGNHDIYFKNTNRVNAPELLLDGYDNITVYEKAEDVGFHGATLLFVPWISPDNYDHTMEAIQNSNARFVLGHLEFQGFEMYRGAVIDHGYSHKIFSQFDLVMSGHYHHKSSKDNVVYLGSPYEMTWSDYDDPRGFHIFDTETGDLEYIQNPFNMFHKVFYDDSEQKNIMDYDFSDLKDTYVKVVVKEKNNPYIFDLFIDRLNASGPIHVQVVEDNLNLDLSDENEIIDEAEDTITIINKYISNLSLQDSKPVVQLLNDLYYEALSA